MKRAPRRRDLGGSTEKQPSDSATQRRSSVEGALFCPCREKSYQLREGREEVLGAGETGKHRALSQERGRGNGRAACRVAPGLRIPPVPATKNFKCRLP